MEQEQDKGFKVTDKRSAFKEETQEETQEEAKEEAKQKTQEQSASEASTEASTPIEEPTQERQEQSFDEGDYPPLPKANFLMLISSLSIHAQISLGVVPNPISQKIEKDLQQAKYNIDMLGILKEKTQGNLTQEEEQTLSSVLYQLRMVYVGMNP